MKYRTIVVDPPWAYRVSSLPPSSKARNGHRSRAAAENYPTMSLEQLRRLPVGDWAEDAAHLYLWTTNAFMVEAHELIAAWGFTQKTIITWVKPQVGMGHYYRNTTEHILFAVRGKLAVARRDARTDFTANRGRHSEKPAAFYDIAASMSPEPRLDVFARNMRFGWDSWGDGIGTDYAPEGLPTPQEVAAATKEGA